MKKILYFASIAAIMAATILACDKAEEMIDPNENQENMEEPSVVETLMFSLGNGENTKSILAESEGKKYGKWETNDRLGSITTKSQGSSLVNADASPVTFAIYSKGGFAVGNTINLWYPYGTKQTDATSIPLTIPSAQYQGVDSFDFDAMPMVSETITVTESMISGTDDTTPVANINMYNLGSLLDFKVFSTSVTYSSERVVSINLTTSTGIVGDFTMDLTAVDADDDDSMEISGIMGTSVTTTLSGPTAIGTNKDNALNVYMVVAPGTYSGTVTVTTDKASYTYTLTDKVWARSSMKAFGLDLASAAEKSNRTPLVKGNFTWVLTEATYSSADESAVVWPHALVTMTNNQGSGTAANNMIPPSNKNDSRFYSNNNLSFNVEETAVEKVLVTTTTAGYATALATSTWTNATASSSETTATIIPNDATMDFSAVVGGQVRATKVQVFFDNNDYTITKECSPVAGGSFTVKKGEDVVSSAKVNSTITLAASPNSGYNFVGWSVKDSENHDVTVTSNQFRMPTSNVTVTAAFAEVGSTPTITITTPSHGTVTTSPSGSAAEGTLVTITATPDSGYGVGSVTVVDADSSPVSVTNNQFTMPNKNVTVTVVFIPSYTLTCSKNDDNTGYATYYNITQNNISWKAPGNQSLGSYWQIGGLKKSKSADSANTATRYICMQGENTLGFDVSTITVYTNGLNNTNLVINSITVTAHNSSADAISGSNAVATFTTEATLTFAKDTDKDLVYTKSGDTDCTGKYFRVAINATNNYTSNYGLKIKSIKLQ